MIAETLRKIEADLRAIIANATDKHPADTFALGMIARQINAQAELIELEAKP